MKNKHKNSWYGVSQGYSLAEILIVVTIIIIVSAIGFGSLIRSQNQQLFNNRFQKIISLISNARSLAITGKGQLDYTDFDHDLCNDQGAILPDGTCNSADFVTPANYGVYFDSANPGNDKVVLFGDINPPDGAVVTQKKDQYDVGGVYKNGDDLNLDTLNVDKNFCVILDDGSATPIKNSGAIFFSPNYADIKFENFVASPFLKIRLRDKGPTNQCKEIKIHKLAGIPEVGPCAASTETCP